MMPITLPPGRPTSVTLGHKGQARPPQFSGLLGKTTSVGNLPVSEARERENKFNALWRLLPFPEHVKGYSDSLLEERMLLSKMNRVKQLWYKVNTLVAHDFEAPVYRIYVSDEAGKAATEKVLGENPNLTAGLKLEVKVTPEGKCAAGKPHLWQDTRAGQERIRAFYDILELARPETRQKIHAVGLQVAPTDREQPVIYALVQDRKAKRELDGLFSEHEARLGGTPYVFEVRGQAQLA